MINLEQQRLEAQNETTSTERLKELAVCNDLITRKYVAMNPNVLPSVLQNLAGQFLEPVFKNPAIDLLLLTNPDLLSQIHHRNLVQIAQTTTSVNILNVLAKHENKKVRQAVAKNTEVTIEILKKLAQDFSYEVRQLVAEHPQINREIIKTILFYKSAVTKLNSLQIEDKKTSISIFIDGQNCIIATPQP